MRGTGSPLGYLHLCLPYRVLSGSSQAAGLFRPFRFSTLSAPQASHGPLIHGFSPEFAPPVVYSPAAGFVPYPASNAHDSSLLPC